MTGEGAAASILLVERDPDLAREVARFLSERGYEIEAVDDGEKAYNRLDSRTFHALVTELRAPRIQGMRLLWLALERNPEICAVMIADEHQVDLATEAMRHGAHDFQTKPLNLGKLDAVIQRGLRRQRLVLEQHELRRRLDERYGLTSLIGRSPQMLRVYDLVREGGRVAEPVLIYGEGGTGKELVAQAIHTAGPRRDAPFVRLGCADVPESVMEIELFGCAAGAAPDVAQARPGRLEAADGGTLFLDDVGELSLQVQEKLVPVIKRKRFQRVGDKRTIWADVRFIAASRELLAPRAEEGRFHPELFALLQALTVDIPPLRQRRDDIPLLVEAFINDAARTSNRLVRGISRNALDVLMRYDWPGNVRQLKNVIEGMVMMARPGRPLEVVDVPSHLRGSASPEAGEIRIPAGATMKEIERIAIEETMKACGFSKEKCAKTLGIGLRTLYRKLHEYEIG